MSFRVRSAAVYRLTAWLAAAVMAAAPAGALDSFKIRLFGNAGLADRIEAASQLATLYREGNSDAAELLAAARADYARIVGALYAAGHYDPVINIRIDGREASDISPLDVPARISRIVAEVRTGEPFRFGLAEVAPLAYATELPSDFAPGKRARAGLIREAVDDGITAWRNVGYAKAAPADQRIVADHATRTLDAQVRIDPGPRLTFGELVVTGTSSVSERRVRQIAGLPTGETFSSDELRRVRRRLSDTGVFRSAALTEAEMPNPDGSLDIAVDLVDQKPRRFGFGAEYATDEGVTVSGFWLHRNLFSDALAFRIGGEVSGIGGSTGGEDFTLTARLTRPATFGSRTDASILAELETIDAEDFDSDSVRLTFGATRRHTDDLTLQAAIRLAYYEDKDASGKTTYRQVFFPFRAILEKRDNTLDTIDGYYVEATAAPFLGISDSEDGAIIDLDARWYEDFGADSRFVLAARVQAGSIIGASITGVPNDLRYYSGGGGTVRGHEFESLGVTLPGGVSSGGRSFLGLQGELRARVGKNLSLVGFYDWGSVGIDSMPGSGGESHAGAGLGLRYATGLGPIRLDVGFPVSGDNEGSDFRLYIGVGQAF